MSRDFFSLGGITLTVCSAACFFFCSFGQADENRRCGLHRSGSVSSKFRTLTARANAMHISAVPSRLGDLAKVSLAFPVRLDKIMLRGETQRTGSLRELSENLKL